MVCLKVGPKSAHPDYEKSKDRLSLGESTILATKGGDGQEQYPSLPLLSSRSRFRSRTFAIPRRGDLSALNVVNRQARPFHAHEERIATTNALQR